MSISRLCKSRLPFDLSLYLIADRPSFSDQHLFFSRIKEAVRGGVSCVQFRDRRNDFITTLKTANTLKSILGKTPLFINTLESTKLARAVEAEGIFLEERLDPKAIRKLLGESVILGIPVEKIEDAISVEQNCEIDYLSVKLFPSKQTSLKNDILWGIEGLRKIRALSTRRVVAIGGLQLDSVESVYRELRPDDGLAMAGALMRESQPYQIAKKIQDIRKKTLEVI